MIAKWILGLALLNNGQYPHRIEDYKLTEMPNKQTCIDGAKYAWIAYHEKHGPSEHLWAICQYTDELNPQLISIACKKNGSCEIK